MKKLWICVSALFLLAVVWLAATGLAVRSDVYIADFAVSENGGELNFRAGVTSSMGYIRAFRDEGGGEKPHYLKFYSAWGGLNSSLGAKSEFTLPLSEGDTEIYVYHGEGSYNLVLKKDEVSGEWRRAG